MNEIQFLMYSADEKVVSAEIAHTTQHGAIEGKTQTKDVKFAIGEYKNFNKHQRVVSDFDREIRKIQGEQK